MSTLARLLLALVIAVSVTGCGAAAARPPASDPTPATQSAAPLAEREDPALEVLNSLWMYPALLFFGIVHLVTFGKVSIFPKC